MHSDLLIHFSNIVIPALIFYIVATGLAQKKDIYESFTKGAVDGMKTVASIAPTLIGLMVSVGRTSYRKLMRYKKNCTTIIF